jgi:hypothetical protein
MSARRRAKVVPLPTLIVEHSSDRVEELFTST